MTKSAKLIRRINKELPHVPLSPDATLISYRGPKDAGQMSWTTLGYPNVSSAETMTDLLLASTISAYNFEGEEWEIGSGKITM
jgi:hypothetical protein